jgi:hypothetical protein
MENGVSLLILDFTKLEYNIHSNYITLLSVSTILE